MSHEGAPSAVDVLIVGAGPAGLVAANTLASSGMRILIVEARERAGHPLRCAEVTRAGFFEATGLEARPEWVRWTLADASGMIVLNRPRMEQDLFQMLGHHGVSLAEGTSLIGLGPYDGRSRCASLRDRHGERMVSASMVIAADGVSSVTARLAGMETDLPVRRLLSSLMYRIQDAHLRFLGHPHTEDHPEWRPGFFWIVPTGRRSANVGISLPADHGRNCRPELDDAIRRTDAMAGGVVTEVLVGGYPCSRPIRRPFTDGLLAVGTAARLIGAARGEGIWYAGLSGRAAARAILGAGLVDLPAVVAAYEEGLSGLIEELEGEIETCEWIAESTGDERNPTAERVPPASATTDRKPRGFKGASAVAFARPRRVESPLDVGQHGRAGPVVVTSACVACGACVPVCPDEAISVGPESVTILEANCSGCCVCLEACPVDGLGVSQAPGT